MPRTHSTPLARLTVNQSVFSTMRLDKHVAIEQQECFLDPNALAVLFHFLGEGWIKKH